MKRLFGFLMSLPLWVMAQSSLPPCPESGPKHACFGSIHWPGGQRYVGEIKYGKADGLGVEYWGAVVQSSGTWREGVLVSSHFVDTTGKTIDNGKTAAHNEKFLSESSVAGAGSNQKSQRLPSLPQCSKSQSFWSDCIGEINTGTASGNVRFVGVFKNNARLGLGIEYDVRGNVIRSGEWEGPVLHRSFPVAAAEPSLDLASPAEPNNFDRQRLTAQVEAERKRRQELEEELERRRLAEARDRPQSSRPATQRSERRVALIIGNSTYKVSPLPNPSNDATDIDEALRRSGFQTTLIRNATLVQMREATRRFADQLPNSDVALIYFAGHGIEANRKNYMIPVNADLKFEYELADQGYDAGIWLEMLESIKSNIVILDACRNNTLIGSRNLGRGLGKMDAPTGTFLAYSTAPGRVAADGARGERNSPFTKHLLRAMQQPGLPIEEVFKEVRRNVSRETSGAQVPWESTSLTGFFAFYGSPRGN
jgi:hypothetical protein